MHIDRGSNGLITILHLFAYYCVLFLILSPCAEMLNDSQFCIFIIFFDEKFDIIKKGEIVGQLAC